MLRMPYSMYRINIVLYIVELRSFDSLARAKVTMGRRRTALGRASSPCRVGCYSVAIHYCYLIMTFMKNMRHIKFCHFCAFHPPSYSAVLS